MLHAKLCFRKGVFPFLEPFCADLASKFAKRGLKCKHDPQKNIIIIFWGSYSQILKLNPHRLAQNKEKPFFINISYNQIWQP
jgi:hypothetical protein